MTTYGQYFEYATTVHDTDDNLWALIDRGVREAEDDDRLHQLLVGEMKDGGDLLDEEDIEHYLSTDDLSPDSVGGLMASRWNDRAEEGGNARLKPGAVEAFYELDPTPPNILQWAKNNIQLTPSTLCDGRYPLPVTLLKNGKWIFGAHKVFGVRKVSAASATIDYLHSEIMVEDERCWHWNTGEKSGKTASLQEAMCHAEAAISENGREIL